MQVALIVCTYNFEGPLKSTHLLIGLVFLKFDDSYGVANTLYIVLFSHLMQFCSNG